MFNKLLQLKTKYLIVLLFLSPLMPMVIGSLIEYYTQNPLIFYSPLQKYDSISAFAIFNLLSAAFYEEYIFRNDYKLNKQVDNVYNVLYSVIIFFSIVAFTIPNNDYKAVIGMFILPFILFFFFLIKIVNYNEFTQGDITMDKGLILSSAAFAAAHLGNFQFVPNISLISVIFFIIDLIFFAIIMSIIRNRYRLGLFITTLIHAGYNLLLIGISLLI
jgi:hypothetical protein